MSHAPNNISLLVNWFSEGWLDDFKNEEEVVDAFIRESSEEELKIVLADLEMIVAKYSDDKIEQLLEYLQCDYSLTDKRSYRGWLKSIAYQIKTSKRHRVKRCINRAHKDIRRDVRKARKCD